MARIPRLAVAIALALGVAACGVVPPPSAPASKVPSASQAGAGLMIGLSLPGPGTDPFLAAVVAAADARAAELGTVALQPADAEGRPDTQLEQVAGFVAANVDAIVVVPVDADATAAMTELATSAGIPLVYVNRRPSDLPIDGSVPYIGSDSLDAGTVEMRALAALAGDRGNVAILMGDPADEAAVLRTEGCTDIVAMRPDMHLVREHAGDWSRERARQITETWLQSEDTPIDVVCANNDEMALGAIEALREAGMLDRVAVGGVDATADALAAMQAGDLEVTVFQDAHAQGAGAIDAAVKLANGEHVPTDEGVIDVPYRLVTPSNVGEFLEGNVP